MKIIPVLDLRHGLVVRARRGERSAYAPIETPLAPTPEPADVLAGLLGIWPFDEVYIADLDAIEGRAPQTAAIAALAAAHPGVGFWIDDALADVATAAGRATLRPGRPVIGTESQTGGDLLAVLGNECVLSLDFRGDAYVGPAAILNEPGAWPRDVVVMTLARVGSGDGPDLDRLAAVRRAAPAARIFAAGGIRGRDDLVTLDALGIAGALVATALHDGRIDRSVIAASAGEPG